MFSSAYQYCIVFLAKKMPMTDDEMFNYRIDTATGKLSHIKPGLIETVKLIKLLGLATGFDRTDKFWWAEDENGEYVRGNSLEEVVLLIAVVYNNERINNFKLEYSTNVTKLDTQTQQIKQSHS